MPTTPEALFVGGGTGGGKTTLANALAARHGLRVFRLDSFWYEYSHRAGETDPPADVQWLEWTPRTQADDFERISRRNFGFALDDLATLSEQPRVLVEGPQILPDLLPEGANAVFLIPTPAFQGTVLSPRPRARAGARRDLNGLPRRPPKRPRLFAPRLGSDPGHVRGGRVDAPRTACEPRAAAPRGATRRVTRV